LKMILLRHGQSLWNLENKFTGWTDVDLSDQGIKEAHRAGKLLKPEVYSIMTMVLCLDGLLPKSIFNTLDKFSIFCQCISY